MDRCNRYQLTNAYLNIVAVFSNGTGDILF